MRILIIDNNIMPAYWGAGDLRAFAAAVPGASVYVRRGPQRDLPRDLAAYDRVVISGSMTPALDDAPWISELHEAVGRLLDLRKPVLGVCYGHQTLARVLGGKETVHRGSRPEFGWSRIEQLAPSALLKGVPEVFHSFSAHYDELTKLPPGARHLARSELCEYQAFQLEDRPVYGIQFHPEKDLAEAEKTFEERRRKGEPKLLLHPNEGPKLYDPKVGETIFRNFFEL
jgi:GMP synthase (glutamine-hydrolysing)